MHTTVIIPYRDRGDSTLLRWTIEGLEQQILPPNHTMDVSIGFDGGRLDDGVAPLSNNIFRFHTFPHIGAAAVRNSLVKLTTGHTDLLVFLNGDTRPFPDMVRQHADTMASLPQGSLVLGSAPWERGELSNVFDAFIAETPAIFNYPMMNSGDWYDFRSGYSINLSVRRDQFLTSGGFHEEIRPVYYEDIACVHRLIGLRKGIYYQPKAQVLHRHPMTLDQYLDREELLGLMAPVFARIAPKAFIQFFGSPTPIQTLAERYRLWSLMDGPTHQSTYQRLSEWASLPQSRLGNEGDRTLNLKTLFQLHVPLKRLAFRLGFLKGLELLQDVHWESRHPQGLWRQAITSRPS